MENLDSEPVIPTLDLTVIDCPDALQLATFYAKLLGWRVEEGSDADWAELIPPRGRRGPDDPDGEASLAFQKVADFRRPAWPEGDHPQQFHLDLSVTDIDAAEPRALALGATVHEHQPSASGSFRVYLDPAGHPFKKKTIKNEKIEHKIKTKT
jgi:predicted enzyme related to lactoylglutathione lyase